MHLALRPYVTTGVAIVGASVLVAAPIQPTPPDIQITKPAESLAIAQRSTNVELTSLVSDLLTAFNTVATAGGNTAKVLLDATGKLPGSVALLIQAAIDNPELIPNLASALVYGFLNPFPVAGTVPLPGPPDFSLLVQLFGAISPVIGLLPPPLGPSGMNPGIVTEISLKLLGVLADALDVLPDPTLALPALGQAAADLPAFVTDLTGAFSALASALGISIGGGDYIIEIPNIFGPVPPTIPVPIPIQGAAPFIGQAPALLLAVLGAAVDNPEDIPGLFSFVVNRLVGFPDLTDPASLLALITGSEPTSLALSLALPTILTLADILPPPLGGSVLDLIDPDGDPGLVLSAAVGLGTILNQFLGLLPEPVSPFPTAPFAALAAEQSVTQPEIPDADVGDVVTAVRRAGDILLGAAEGLPEGLKRAVQTVVANPDFAPAVAVQLVNGGIDAAQAALGGITAAALGNLPKALRTPVVRAGAEVDGAINNLQRDVQRAVAPRMVAEQSVALNEVTSEEGPEVKPKKHRQRVELNVFKINPLDQDKKEAEKDVVENDGSGTETNVSSFPSHRPGIGKTPVRDLVKRVLGGSDRDKKGTDDNVGEGQEAG